MITGFDGFPRELFTFLEELKANNNKQWFQDNRSRYDEYVVAPVLDFIELTGLAILPNISHAFTAEAKKSGGSMFRIFRDTRFSHDKRPYKENVGCQFRHRSAKDAHCPGFYLHLAPEEVFIGAGIWRPDGPTIKKIRTRIVTKPDEWQAAVHAEKVAKHFTGFEGEQLKHPPRGFDPDAPHMDDLRRKSFFLFKDFTAKDTQSPDFINQVDDAFTHAGPLVRFVCQAVGVEY